MIVIPHAITLTKPKSEFWKNIRTNGVAAAITSINVYLDTQRDVTTDVAVMKLKK